VNGTAAAAAGWAGYFDANATTPLFPEVRDVLGEAWDTAWANASGLHHAAGAARRRLEEAREEVADRLGAGDPERIVFLSGATESVHGVFRHVAAAGGDDGAWVLTSPLEHPCVRAAAAESFPGRVRETPLAADGTVDVAATEALLDRDGEPPALVSVMAANNETGALQPWAALREACAARGIPFHCDAAQWLGKLPAAGLGTADWVTGSGHKFGGPKGVGFLVVPEGLERLRGGFGGGPQEGGRRAGTENVPGILALAAALGEAERRGGSAEGRDAFERRLLGSMPGLRIVGGSGPRLWNTSMFVLPHGSNLKWLTLLSHRGFQVSTGSACSAGRGNPSHVMAAMGVEPEAMGRVIRASSLWSARTEDWLALAGAVETVDAELRDSASGSGAPGERKIRW
jgi:cysteine desulfurase